METLMWPIKAFIYVGLSEKLCSGANTIICIFSNTIISIPTV